MLSSALRALAPAAAIIALVAAMTAAAAPDRKPPRIVAAAMIDANRNSRADRVRLTYSEPVRHARQAAGRFPFSVAGYRINSAERASARTLVVVLGERQVADPTSAPVIRYARTRTKPVVDRAGNQALAQTFRTTRTGPKSAWRIPYRFARTCGIRRYRFRLRIPREGDYPYATGASPITKVRVRGRPCP